MSLKTSTLTCFLTGFLSLAFLQQQAFSQISGTKTVCSAGCDFATIGLAITGMQTLGLSGPVILELDPSYVSTSETFPLSFSGLATSVSKTIVVRPKVTVASVLSISGSHATAILNLDGAAFITVDGRPGGAGSASMITVENADLTAATIRFINEASNNTIKYLSIKGAETSTTSCVVLFSTTSGTTGNDNNTISNCNIADGVTRPANGIYAMGTAGALNNNNTINNCNIYNFFLGSGTSSGIMISDNNSDWVISNNHIYRSL